MFFRKKRLRYRKFVGKIIEIVKVDFFEDQNEYIIKLRTKRINNTEDLIYTHKMSNDEYKKILLKIQKIIKIKSDTSILIKEEYVVSLFKKFKYKKTLSFKIV